MVIFIGTTGNPSGVMSWMCGITGPLTVKLIFNKVCNVCPFRDLKNIVNYFLSYLFYLLCTTKRSMKHAPLDGSKALSHG